MVILEGVSSGKNSLCALENIIRENGLQMPVIERDRELRTLDYGALPLRLSGPPPTCRFMEDWLTPAGQFRFATIPLTRVQRKWSFSIHSADERVTGHLLVTSVSKSLSYRL